uniref:Uncharacterized protein n=1 Tax=Magallana gigas TaxID=29159 RepID=K1PSL9_MAGGI
MATRENSNDQKRKRKGALTDLPIKYQATTLNGIIPDIPGHENLPHCSWRLILPSFPIPFPRSPFNKSTIT